MDQLRCPSRIVGRLVEGGDVLEVKCQSAHCGAGRGRIVFHYFDLATGELTDTKSFKDPRRSIEQAQERGGSHVA